MQRDEDYDDGDDHTALAPVIEQARAENEDIVHFSVTNQRLNVLLIITCMMWVALANFGFDASDKVDPGVVITVLIGSPLANAWGCYFATRRCTHGVSTRSMLVTCLLFVPMTLALCVGFAPDMAAATMVVTVSTAWDYRRARPASGAMCVWWYLPVIACGALATTGAYMVSDPRVVISQGGYRMFDEGQSVAWAHGLTVVSGVCMGIGASLWTTGSNPALCISYANTITALIGVVISLFITVSETGYGSLSHINFFETCALMFYGAVLYGLQLAIALALSIGQTWTVFVLMCTCVSVLPITQSVANNNDRVDNKRVTQVQTGGLVIVGIQVVILAILLRSKIISVLATHRMSFVCSQCRGADGDSGGGSEWIASSTTTIDEAFQASDEPETV